MQKRKDNYIPALSYDGLTPLYDSLIRWTTPEQTFKLRLIEQARITRNHRVLDLGCGTATLTLLIKETHPEAAVVGLDGDPKILQIAGRKALAARLDITFNQGMSYDLPYPDAPFDRILSSLVIHHLTHENKIRTLNEVHRVLSDGGEMHIADFGKPHNALMLAASLPWRMFDGMETTSDNVQGALPEMMRRAGFIEVHESARYMTLFGTLSLHVARKP
ncbi:MAG: methyltransferase domain-containing protein [Pyrinomonadaceae bacterium]|nr:methyltransferase domain-containing protein [Pyrinomonadaceae bacterium]